MLKDSASESILANARKQEQSHRWLGAAESYSRLLDLSPPLESPIPGEVYEQLGYALFRAAMQSGGEKDFRERLGKSVEKYRTAQTSYTKQEEGAESVKAVRCSAMIAHLGFWLASEAPKKKALVKESWEVTKQALRILLEKGNALEYRRTFNQLFANAVLQFDLEWDSESRRRVLNEAAEFGEQAIKLYSTPGNNDDLASIYIRTACCLGAIGNHFLDSDEKENYVQKAQSYSLKANKLSEKTASLEAAAFYRGGYFEPWETDTFLAKSEKTLERALETDDKFLIGSALDWLQDWSFRKALGIEDPDERARILDKALSYAKKAKLQYSIISYVTPKGGPLWAEAPEPAFYRQQALFEADTEKKRDLLVRALETTPGELRRAEESGYPGAIRSAHTTLSKILTDLAKLEGNPENKRRHLEEAILHRVESNRITEQIEPLFYWDRGSSLIYLGDTKSELAVLAHDPDVRRAQLSEALSDMEAGLKLWDKQIKFWERRVPVSENIALLARWKYGSGDLFNRLYQSTHNKTDLKNAASAYDDAAQSFLKVDLRSRSAESYWKAAQAYEVLGEHLKAAQNFSLASNSYNEASKKIPELKDLYEEHVSYMQAWNEIERARYHHSRHEYNSASESYERASTLHRSTRHWKFLAPNYSAWAQLEKAEDLSRKEQTKEAIRVFEDATGLFEATKKSLQKELNNLESLEERRMITKLIDETDPRRGYCTARVALEEAKILDRIGDHQSSSEKYGQASELLQKITHSFESEQAGREIRLITTLSKAWQMMTLAEAEESPEHYIKASELFEEAKELSLDEKAKMLASGHSWFCKALERGSLFVRTKDPAAYAASIQHLENASNTYLNAGFQTASEYTKGTRLLFEAYVYMQRAATEQDQEKEAKYYAMAEKVLQASASAFSEASHFEKKEQVEKLLQKAREERELALSLVDVLRAPSMLSTTETFSSPAPGREKSVGSERFEHASILANIILNQKSLMLGDDLRVEIELVNPGRGPAQIVRVEEVIPEGFELIQKPDNCKVEDRSLNLRGKKLDPLKTEEIRLVLKSKANGLFTLKPRVMYLDESGRPKSHEPEPVEISVKEFGLSSWLKGRR